MTGLITKLIVCPLVVYLSSVVFPQVFYTSVYQPLVVGIILALAAQIMGVVISRQGTEWINTAIYFVIATIGVYFISMLFAEAEVTLTGALLTAALLGIAEIIQHVRFTRTEKTQKSN